MGEQRTGPELLRFLAWKLELHKGTTSDRTTSDKLRTCADIWETEVAQLEEGLSATRIELGMALTERAAVIMKYEQLEEENGRLWRYVDHDWDIDDSDAFIYNFLVGHPGEGKFVCKCGLDALRTQEPA